MVKMEDCVIARLESHGETFEILVDPYLANDLKNDKEVNFQDLLATEEIFKKSGAAEQQTKEAIKKVFGEISFNEIIKQIITKGKVQLTTAQRHDIAKAKKKEIIYLISRSAYNPQTKIPHPPIRIENAIDESKIQIDIFKSAEEQIPEIINKIKILIPISIETIELAIKVPSQHAARTLSVLRAFKLKKQEWQNNGSLIAVFSLPAGMKTEFIGLANKFTNGTADIKFIE